MPATNSTNSSSSAQQHSCPWPLYPAKTLCSEANSMFLPLLSLPIAINCLLSMASVTGNALWIAAYSRTPSLQTPLNMCLLSLASVGVFNGAVMQPLIVSDAIFFLVCPSTACSLEYIVTAIVILVADSTLQNIAVICIDRYIAVLYSIKYNQMVTKKRILIAFCLYALFRLFLSACVFTGIIDYTALVIASISFSVVMVLYTCVRIFLKIRCIGSAAVGIAHSDEERKKAQERKITTTVGAFVGISVACFCPALGYFVAIKITFVDGELHVILWRYIETMMMLNALLNFSYYYWRHEEKRIAVRKVINDAYNAIKTCACH